MSACVFAWQVTDFCRDYGLPQEAETALLECLAALEAQGEAELLSAPVERYGQEDERFPYRQELKAVTERAKALGLDPCTAAMLFAILLVPHGRELYRRQGVGEQVIYDSFADLKWKIWECYRVYGVWGVFVAWWFDRWFDASRYAIGRLQFELCRLGEFPGADALCRGDARLRPDMKVINVHIPSSGHMPYGAVREAYEKAAAFFAPQCERVIFACESWLLYPRNGEFLPEKSNIRPFAADYELFHWAERGPGQDLWRLFYVPPETELSLLPEEDSLQRAMKAWLLEGNAPGEAAGLFVWT